MKQEFVSAGLRVVAAQAAKMVSAVARKLGANKVADSRSAAGAITTAAGYAVPFVTNSPTAEAFANELRVSGMTEIGVDLTNKMFGSDKEKPRQ